MSDTSVRLGSHASRTSLSDSSLGDGTAAADSESWRRTMRHTQDDHVGGTSDFTPGDDDIHGEDEPLAQSTDEPFERFEVTSATRPAQSLTYFNCLALVVGLQIGSGIFSTPAYVSSQVPSPFAATILWTSAGALCWSGASCFIELGTTIPENGGIQEYLCAGYGSFAGFMFSASWIAVVKPCSIAATSIIFGEHVNRLLGVEGSWVADKIVTLLGVWGITTINCLGVKTGARVAGWFLIMKLIMLASIILAGTVYGIRNKGGQLAEDVQSVRHSLRPRASEDQEVGGSGVWDVIGHYVSAAFAALWAYGGWESIGFFAGEMKNASRDLPRVINSGMAIVTMGFTLMVLALYIVLPVPMVQKDNTPIVTFADALYGRTGSSVYTIAIAMSAFGAANANIFAFGRLVASAAQRGYIPSFIASNPEAEFDGSDLSTVSNVWPLWLVSSVKSFAKATARLRLEENIPVYAMLLNALLTSFYVLTGTFRGLVTFITLVEYLILMFTVVVLWRLRSDPSRISKAAMRELPTTASTYRTYTANIIIFAGLSLFLVVRGVITDPRQGVTIIGAFGFLYTVWRLKLKGK